jgi:murein DD-endopeptidase MepM/ murein hydrolase activator NlpD
MRVTASYKSKKYKNLFGWTHYGIDITNADRNAPRIVYANGKGKVTHVGEHPTAGKFICILYKDAELVSGAIKDVVIRYFHLEKINVKSGTYVNKDTIIAIYGNTGSSTAAHLHVEVDLDAREKYANYTPQTSKSNNYMLGNSVFIYRRGFALNEGEKIFYTCLGYSVALFVDKLIGHGASGVCYL